MPTTPKIDVDDGVQMEPESVPNGQTMGVRKYVTGDFSELRCARESRAAVVIEESGQFIEIDVGRMINEASGDGMEDSKDKEEPIRVRVELVLDFYDEWEDDSLYLIQRNEQYLFQSKFKNCKGSLSKEDCKQQLRDVCRQNKPDSLGHMQSFTFLYDPAQELKLKLSISQDAMAKRPNEQTQNTKFAFGLGLYALFVYRK